MALERRSISLVDLLDFIVTVNKGIEPPDCWIFLPRTETWFRRVWGLPAESELLRDRTCCTLNRICHFPGMRDVDRVAGARNFDLMAVGSRGVPAFEVGVDGSVRPGYHHPAWFVSPRSRGDDRFEIVRKVEYLRSRHETGLLGRQVSCEVLMKLRGVEVRETVRCLLYCTRLAEVAWEALAVVRLVLSSVGHVGSHVHQSGDRRICARFRAYGSPIAVRDKNARSVLKSKGAFGGSHIVFKRSFRFLDDADVVAILDQDVVNTLPAGAIRPGTVNQNNIPDPVPLILC